MGKKHKQSKSSFFFFSSRRRHTRYWRDWSSDVCSSDLDVAGEASSLLCEDEHPTIPSCGGATAPSFFVSELVLRVHGAADVDSGEDREDVGLQQTDDELEADQQRCRDQGNHTDGEALRELRQRRDRQERMNRQEDQRQDDGAGEQVGEETDGEGERPGDERRDELNRRQQDVQQLRRAGREQRVLEV